MTTAWAGARSSSASQPDADERGEIAARDRRGARESRDIRPAASGTPAARRSPPSAAAARRSARACSPRCTSSCAPARSPRASRISPMRIRDAASVGSISIDAPVSRERLIGLPLLRLDIGEIAHQERAVGRCRDGLLVQPRGLVEAIRLRGPAGGRHVLLLRAGAQHFDAPRDRLQLRIELDGRLERGQRLGFARRAPAAPRRGRRAPARSPAFACSTRSNRAAAGSKFFRASSR